jgi:hypothetical protein
MSGEVREGQEGRGHWSPSTAALPLLVALVFLNALATPRTVNDTHTFTFTKYPLTRLHDHT